MSRFRVNEPNVVFEAFDEEIVLVNLETGNYYSLRSSGIAIWTALAAGASHQEIVDRLGSAVNGSEAAALVAAFVNDLVAAELLVADERVVPREGAGTLSIETFEAPVLESYHDMQDLLMLDPIHDVDNAGWPIAKEA